MAKEQDENLQMEKMFAAAHRDPELKRRLLADPRAVAKEWKVTLAAEEVERLTSLGTFVELADELRHGSLRRCDRRVCYPSSTWLRAEAATLVHELARERFRYYPVRYGIYYPPRYQIRYMRPLYPVLRYPIRYPIRYHVFYPRGYYFRGPRERFGEFEGRDVRMFRRR